MCRGRSPAAILVLLMAAVCGCRGLVLPLGVIALDDGVTGRLKLVSNLTTAAIGTVIVELNLEPEAQIQVSTCPYVALAVPGFRLYTCDFPMENSASNFNGLDTTVALRVETDSTVHVNYTFADIKLFNDSRYNAIHVLGGRGCLRSDFAINHPEQVSSTEQNNYGFWTEYNTSLGCFDTKPVKISAIAPWIIGVTVGVFCLIAVFYIAGMAYVGQQIEISKREAKKDRSLFFIPP